MGMCYAELPPKTKREIGAELLRLSRGAPPTQAHFARIAAKYKLLPRVVSEVFSWFLGDAQNLREQSARQLAQHQAAWKELTPDQLMHPEFRGLAKRR